jgi:cellulose synthase/poly-beta-1,6-N-acetylglucosamine synthase-like glycosyltransferase
VFFASILSIVYIYIGYPFLILMISKLRPRLILKNPITPSVTILIAAYNEVDCIAGTIENKLSIDYPKDKLEVIVVSDGSTDGTDGVVRRYDSAGVQLIRQEPRAGKTSALNLAMPKAKGDIIVFSDANSRYAPDAISYLLENFNDPTVGYVTGKMIYTNPDGSTVGDGCSAYMKYENLLRTVETKTGSVVGVDGGIDAFKKTLYCTMNSDQLPDFVLPLKIIEQGFRVVYESRAILREQSLTQTSDEYRMRVRVCLRALWAVWDMRSLLFNSTYKLFAFQLWSHKVLRYCCFIFLIALYISNFMLMLENDVLKLCMVFQTVFYFASLIAPFFEKRGVNIKFIALIRYFVIINVASMNAVIKFLRGQKIVVWQPRKG